MSRRKPGKKKKKTKTTTTTTRSRPNYKAARRKIQSQTPPPSTSSSESVIINNNLDHVIHNLKQENDKVVVERKDDDDDGPKRFYGCYLLTSLSPRFKGHSYIGFTVNPKRRIRQHNGEITCGAFKTKKKRPWEMILCIHGFPSHTSALQFEWAWQHPRKSLAVQEAAASFKTLGGLANKIKLALTMLTLHSWQSMNLTVSFFSTKYMNHAAGCPSLPQQMKLHFCSMDELPCYSDYPHVFDDEDDFDSNDSGSANYSDDRLEASADDSMEMNLPSDHLQSCTIQNPSDSFLAGDQIGSGGLWEFEPSSVMGVPEELMQPVHQLPVDISGSMLNTSNELFWPGEEFWNEDVRGSFPDLEKRAQPIVSICTSENNICPALEGKQSSCQLPVDVRTSTWNDSYEHTRLRNEDRSGTEENNIFPALEENLSPCQLSADVPTSTWNDLYEHTRLRNEDESETEERRSSVHVMEEQIQPFQQVAPETEQSAMVDLVSVVEDTANKDETTCIVLDDIINQNEDGSGTEERRSSLHVMEEQIQPFQQVVPEREQSTMVGLVSVIEDAAKNDETTCIIIDDINEEKCQPKRVRSPLRPSNTHRAFSTEGIEVIELCTPSPDCRIITGSKKRRVNSGIPDIIDLTRSPSFIQL